MIDLPRKRLGYATHLDHGCSGCQWVPPVGTGWCGGGGPDTADLVIVSERPGDTEVVTGKPFSGKAGELLDATLASVGIRRRDCYVTNAVMCPIRPRTAELDSCWPRLRDEILSRKPKLILTLGSVALAQLLREEIRRCADCDVPGATHEVRDPKGKLVGYFCTRHAKVTRAQKELGWSSQRTRIRSNLAEADGTLLWQPELQCWILPTWHPAAVLRGGADDRFYPRIHNAIWRAERYISGKSALPDVNAKAHYPWTFFQQPEGAEKALRYYLKQANGAQELGYAIELSCDTESRSPGYGRPPQEIIDQLPESTREALVPKGTKKGRPHPFSDEWIMLQLYDGQRAAAIAVPDCLTQGNRFLLRKLLKHPAIIWIGHNFAQYDTQVLRANKLPPPPDDQLSDTLTWGLGLSERSNAVGLEPLSRTWLNAPAYKKGLRTSGYRHQKGPQNQTQWNQLARYGVDDVYNAYELNRILPGMVHEEGTASLIQNLILPLAQTCGKLSARGFPVDVSHIATLERRWGGRTEELISDLRRLATEAGFPTDPSVLPKGKQASPEFNPRSHIQLAHMAFDVLGLRPTDGATNRKFSGTAKNLHGRERAVDADFLASNEHPGFCGLMTKLRMYDKLVRTYVRGLAREIDADGLIHPDASVAATATGRLVWKPLLQVLPHYGAHSQLEEEDFAKDTRRLFPARPGYVIVSADFKQLEFRIAWMLSQDANLGRALMSTDMHSVTASMMFQKPIETVTKADRHAAKRVGFGVAYNRSAFTLAQGPLLDILGGIDVPLHVRQAKAQEYIDSFWRAYPDYRKAFLQWQRDAITKGELVTPFGRKRRWMLITYENKRGIENQACNYPIQSTASDFCSTALIRLANELPARGLGYPLYTVHDEIVCEVKEDRLDEGIRAIAEIMSNPPIDTGAARFPVDPSYGPNLGDLTPYELAA